VWDRIDANNLSIAAVTIGCIAGAVVGVQRALNGQINEYSHQSFTTSLLNFITGTSFLIIMIFIDGKRISKHSLSRCSSPIYLEGSVVFVRVSFNFIACSLLMNDR
jgi:uncharacterized membrane protein YdcZ (DUF606 family)